MNTEHSQREDWTVALKILSHLVENPQAQDDLEGIVDWWLLEQDIRREAARVKAALEVLVREGLVLRAERGDRTRYRLNPERLAEARRLLNSAR